MKLNSIIVTVCALSAFLITAAPFNTWSQTQPAPTCQANYPAGTTIPAGCPQPPNTMPDTRPRDASGNLIIPATAGGMTFNEYVSALCPSPCSRSTADLESDFAWFAAYEPGTASDPSTYTPANGGGGSSGSGGGSSGGSGGGGGGGGGSSSCSSAGGTGFSPLSTMFGPNLTAGIANTLVSNGIIPQAVADVLSLPNAPADKVAWAMQQLQQLGLPTNAYDLAKNSLPLLTTTVNGVVSNGILDTLITQAGTRALTPSQVQALQFAKNQALGNGGVITLAARDALRLAGLPTTVGGLSDTFGIGLDTTSITGLAGADNLLPSELDDIRQALDIVSGLEGLGDGSISATDIQDVANAAQQVGAQLGLGNLTIDEVAQIVDGINSFSTAAATAAATGAGPQPSAQDVDDLLNVIANDPNINRVLGSAGLNVNEIASAYADISKINNLAGGNANVVFGNMNSITAAFGNAASVSTVLTSFQGLANLSGAGSAQQVSSLLSFANDPANKTAVQAVLGANYQQTLNSLGALNGIQNLDIGSISGAFSAAQKVMSSGVLSGSTVANIASVFKSLNDTVNLPQFSSKFQNIDQAKDALTRLSQISGLGNQTLNNIRGFATKLNNISVIGKLGLDKFSKALKAPDVLKKINTFGVAKLQASLDKIKSFGPAQLQKLFEKIPGLPIDKLNNVLSGGLGQIDTALRNIPGANTLLNNVPGGLNGVVGALGSLNFSSAGCLISSLGQKLLCPDGPTPVDCKGSGPSNAATGPGPDNTYSNYCFAGPLKPVSKIASVADVETATSSGDEGVDGAKMRSGCIGPKNTDSKSVLNLNNGWLWLEQSIDNPTINANSVTVEGQSPYYKESENEHKLKGALVNELGGVSTTTFGMAGNIKCNMMKLNAPRGLDCPGANLNNLELAQLNRFSYDACTNDFIFSNMMGLPGMQHGVDDKASTEGMNFIFDPEVVRGEAVYDQSWCQPFKMIPVQCEPDLMAGSGGLFGGFGLGGVGLNAIGNALGLGGGGGASGKCLKKSCERGGCTRSNVDKYDYEAWRYLARNWFRVLDVKYMPTRSGSASMPNAGDNGSLQSVRASHNSGPTRGRIGGFGDDKWKTLGDGMAKDSWGNVDVQLNGLIKHPYERIWDPTHPFSPRYDYNGNDRDRYSPRTAAYFELSACSVRCAAVKVDILGFRAEQFSKCMNCRLAVNTACFWSEVFANAACPGLCIPLPTAIQNARNGASVLPICVTPLKIAKKWPPCNTKFDKDGGKDNVKWMCSGCTRLSGDPDADNGVKKCCSDLAKPVAPINTLKIRTKDNISRQLPEGYQFSEYFDDHKPYMRWWDTGGEADSPGEPNGDQMSMCGAKDALIGVGNEKKGCNLGGSDGKSIPCVTIDKPDPLTSWMELKLYQTNTFRQYRLNCLGQYEKLFKSNSAEDFVLARLGKTFYSLDEKGRATPKLFPESWRGYVTDPESGTRFPNQGGSASAAITTGLDTAKAGDVLIWDKDVNNNRLPHTATVVGVMTRATNPNIPDKEKVVVVRETNSGKYPDSCGTTDAWGMGSLRYLHKNCIVFEGKKSDKSSSNSPLGQEDSFYEPFLPTGSAYTSSGGLCFVAQKGDSVRRYTFSCEDTNLQACEEKDWDKIKVYRPCDPVTQKDCRD